MLDKVPVELKSRPQWVLWRYEKRNGKQTKVPYTVHGARASSTSAADWSTFDWACDRAPLYEGVGFVFAADDPYVGVDLDDALDDKGELAVGRWRR